MNCLRPTDPHTYYCPDCASSDAVNPLVTYLPFEGVRFTYGGLARIWGWLLPHQTPSWVKVFLTLGFVAAWPIIVPLLLIFWVVERDRVTWYALWAVVAIAAVAIAWYFVSLLSQLLP